MYFSSDLLKISTEINYETCGMNQNSLFQQNVIGNHQIIKVWSQQKDLIERNALIQQQNQMMSEEKTKENGIALLPEMEVSFMEQVIKDSEIQIQIKSQMHEDMLFQTNPQTPLASQTKHLISPMNSQILQEPKPISKKYTLKNKQKRDIATKRINSAFRNDAIRKGRDIGEIDKREYTVIKDCEEIQKRLKEQHNRVKIFAEEDAKGEGSLFNSEIGRFEKEIEPNTELNLEFNPSIAKGLSYHTIDGAVGVAGGIGGRYEQQEDAHISTTFNVKLSDGAEQEVKMTGVFDGHGGTDCSTFASIELQKHLKERLESLAQEEGLLELDGSEQADMVVWNALKLAFVDTSRSFPGSSGSTANVSLMIGDSLWIANLGDSRAMLVSKGGKTKVLSQDAVIRDPNYRKTIEHRGGNFYRGRVEGSVLVPRSFGDQHALATAGVMPSRPKITKFSKQEWEGYFLVQCCDGIFERGVATSNQVGSLIGQRLCIGDSLAVSAAKVVEAAYNSKSSDNLSVLISPLTSTGKWTS